MAEVTIEIRKTGPYRVTGDFKLLDHEGNPVPLPEGKTTFSLCRCGASVTKPFCDGTHSRIGFLAATDAQQKSDGTGTDSKPSV